MSARKVRTGVTLAVLAVLLAGMLLYGWKATSAPFPSFGGGSDKKTTCKATQVKRRITRAEITVSVYNDSDRSGLADRTLTALEKRSFKAGDKANAPDGVNVSRVEVRSTVKDDPAATLVARQFKPTAKVVLAEDSLGPGIDVVLGPKYTKLRTPAPKVLRLAKPQRTCADN